MSLLVSWQPKENFLYRLHLLCTDQRHHGKNCFLTSFLGGVWPLRTVDTGTLHTICEQFYLD